MKAEQIMTRDPRTVTPNQTVAEAVKVMASENCGIVPVVESDRDTHVVGVITDRDIALRACKPNARGPEETISSVMTSNVFCVNPADDVSRVYEVMENAGIRRVPVVTEDKKLLGIISLKDVAEQSDEREVGEIETKVLQQRPNN